MAAQHIDLSVLRTALRRQRNALSHEARRQAALAVNRRIQRLGLLRRAARVAVYRAIDGEVDLAPVLRSAIRARCEVYEPLIVDLRARAMHFAPASHPLSFTGAQRKIAASRAGCNLSRRISPRNLDLVLVPLVAFDAHGWRAGFGAGFYDRAFAFMRRAGVRRPLLIGIAYDFQRVARQIPRPWDVLLHGVVTDKRFYRCRSSLRVS